MYFPKYEKHSFRSLFIRLMHGRQCLLYAACEVLHVSTIYRYVGFVSLLYMVSGTGIIRHIYKEKTCLCHTYVQVYITIL